MNYSGIPGLDKNISRLIFGCCNRSLINGDADAYRILDDAFSVGFTAFDTARVYGMAEHCLGSWALSNGIRDQITIITKGCHPDDASRLDIESLRRDLDTSLAELKSDYVDVYMLHRDDPGADIEGILIELDRYVKSGVIKKIGVSNWTHQRIQEANELAHSMGVNAISVSSPQFSVVKQVDDPWGGCISISYDDSALEWYSLHPEISLFTYSALAHGFLSGRVRSTFRGFYRSRIDDAARTAYWYESNFQKLRYVEQVAMEKKASVSQIAISAINNRGLNAFPILTSTKADNMKQNVAALDITLTRDEIEALWKE